MSDASVIRTGLVTAVDSNLFPLEQLLVDPRFELAWITSDDGSHQPLAEQFQLKSKDHSATRCDAETELVVVNDSPQTAVSAIDFLISGRTVAMAESVYLDAGHLRRLKQAVAANSPAANWCLLRDYRLSAEDALVAQLLRSNAFGELQTISRSVFTPAFPGRTQVADATNSSFTRLLRDFSLLVRIAGNSGVVEQVASGPVGHCHVVIRLDDRSQAILTRHIAAGLVHDTGWIVSGSRGGYANGRLWKLEADGECYDVAPPPLEPYAVTPLDELYQRMQIPTHHRRSDEQLVGRLATLRESAVRTRGLE